MEAWPPMKSASNGASVAVLPDAESLALAAATVVLAEARRAIRAKGRFTIALSGGSTPKPIYRLLAASPFVELMPWKATDFFWGDERCVGEGDPRSNEGMAREALLDHVPVPADRIHPIACETPVIARTHESKEPNASGEASAREAAERYERLLRDIFGGASPSSGAGGIDVVLLGMGENGHTASLFPGSSVLDERERWAAASLEDPDTARVTSSTGERLWRVTLTAPFINRSALVLFVVSGSAKAAVVKTVLEGGTRGTAMPATLVRPTRGRLWWLLDDAAAHLFEAGSSGGARQPLYRATEPARPHQGESVESFDDLPGCEAGPSR